MAIPTVEAEYSTILRVSGKKGREIGAGVQVPAVDGYELVGLLEPQAVIEYCRDMTLARGRLLYDVWDFWLDKHLGYLVPDEIFSEAKSSILIGLPGRNRGWRMKRQMFGMVQGAILQHFPRLPAFSRSIVAEEGVVQLRGQQFTRAKIEEIVIRHALFFFTSYSFRRAKRNQSETEALDAVKVRLREVLKNWLSVETTGQQLMHFFARNAVSYPGDRDTTPMLMYYGGAETVANLVSPLNTASSWA